MIILERAFKKRLIKCTIRLFKRKIYVFPYMFPIDDYSTLAFWNPEKERKEKKSKENKEKRKEKRKEVYLKPIKW